MADVKKILEPILKFPTYHEPMVGKVAILSSQIERQVDELFGYVFNLPYENWKILTLSISSIQRKIDILKHVEPPRVYRRLQLLRGWSHGQAAKAKVFT